MSAQERQVALGNDDRTGQPVYIALGRRLPSILSTSAELERWREAVFGEKRRRGAVYSWNHPTVGPLAMAKKGDVAALARTYAIEGPVVRPAAGDAPGGNPTSAERWREISSYPQRVATRLEESAKQLNAEKFQAANAWEKSALPLGIISLYELIADSGAVSPELDGKIRESLKAWLALLLADPMLLDVHNMGSALQPGAWAIAVLLQDEEALRKLFEIYDMGQVRYSWLQDSAATAKAVDMELGDASQKVKASHRRQFVVLPECILIADTLASESPVSFDWWVHGERKGTAAFEGQTSASDDGFPGYLEPGLVTMNRKAVPKAGETFDVALAGETRMGIRYTLLSPSKLDLYLGAGISPRHGGEGVYPDEPTPYAVLRHSVASAASFLFLAEPYREKGVVRSARVARHKGPRWKVKIQLKDGTSRVITADGKGFRLDSR